MECKNLIVLTGMSCQGKTHIAVRLRELCGFHIISTDIFYHPIGKPKPRCQVGSESPKKNEFIRSHKPLLTETTIIEGSHIGNRKELNIYKRELEFTGDVLCFKVNSPRHKEFFAMKHGENSQEEFGKIKSWFDSIYNLREVYIVESAEEVISLLDDKYVCLSR